MSGLLQHYVARSAEARDGAPAIVMGDERLSYAELEAASNRLARALQSAGLARGERVCLFVPKSPAAIVAILAVLKADGVYVPIDLASPAPRVAMIVGSADPRLVLAGAGASKLLDELLATGGLSPAVPIVSLAEDAAGGERFRPALSTGDWQDLSSEPVASANGPGDAAHLLFTSGSTGMPKGVVITHGNVVSFVDWAVEYFGMRAGERISGHTPLHFDLSTFDIFGAFAAGATLYPFPAAASLLPGELAALIRSEELTQWFSVPSAMAFMAKFGVIERNDFPTLERVLWCGEVLPTPVLIHWMERLPGRRFTNLYGPTEATIASSYYTVAELPGDPTAPIPIGTACAGEELLVLGPDLLPLPPGETGDLFIGGVGLSPGYWRDEEKTAAAFIRRPHSAGAGERIYRTGDLARAGDDGLVHFLGRADTQIKSRGYRIELGEIETALNALGILSETAVVGAETDGYEGTVICCAYAPGAAQTVTPRLLREGLRKVLPPYMLPARWLAFEALPKNANGKIDRRALRETFEGQDRTPVGAEQSP